MADPATPHVAPQGGPGGAYRVDPLSGDLVRVVASRQHRPNHAPVQGVDQSVDPRADLCPFCPGGTEAPDPYQVRWFPNRWPAMPGDVCEVVLYSSDHQASFGSLELDQATAVVDLWAERTAALGARSDIAYVLVFENRGASVGATIAHPHGQIYGFDLVPPRAIDELRRPSAAALGPEAPGGRQVSRSGDWRAWVPWAAGWPYSLVVAPESPVPDLPSLAPGGRRQLAQVLGDSLGRLDRLFGEPMPYMMWFHQRPFDGQRWSEAWLHAHVAPLLRAPATPRFVASGELGGGILFNPVDPDDAAAALRLV